MKTIKCWPVPRINLVLLQLVLDWLVGYTFSLQLHNFNLSSNTLLLNFLGDEEISLLLASYINIAGCETSNFQILPDPFHSHRRHAAKEPFIHLINDPSWWHCALQCISYWFVAGESSRIWASVEHGDERADQRAVQWASWTDVVIKKY